MTGRGEAERVVALAQEIGDRLGTVLKDVIPPDAQRHLIKAQQELLTALFLIYQHQAGGRRPAGSAPRRRATPRAKPRVTRIELDDEA